MKNQAYKAGKRLQKENQEGSREDLASSAFTFSGFWGNKVSDTGSCVLVTTIVFVAFIFFGSGKASAKTSITPSCFQCNF